MYVTCVIIAGALWMNGGPHTDMFQVTRVAKEAGHELVHVWDAHNHRYEFTNIQQWQVRMDAPSFMEDCILSGYEMITYDEVMRNEELAYPYHGDDIDDQERTGLFD